MLELIAAALLATAPVPAVVATPVSTDPGDTSTMKLLEKAVDYSFAQANRIDVGGGVTKVAAEAGTPTPRSGFFPVRVFVDNTEGPGQTMRLSFSSSMPGARAVSRTIELKAGERRTVSLLAPYSYRYGRLSVRAPGVTQKGEASLYFNAIYGSQRLVLSLGSADDFEKGVGQAALHTPADLQVMAIPVDEAPTELAAYVGYDAVAIPKAGLDALSEGTRRALEAYVATGGALLVANAGRGAGAYFPLAQAKEDDFADYGLGWTLFCTACGKLSLSKVENAATHRELTVLPSGPQTGYRAYNQPVIDALLPQATAPLGRFLAIIGVFTLLIGPGSVFVARRRGPAALLVTIPGIAFATCALIIGSSLVQDGFTVHASSHGFTLLDSQRHRALTVGVTAYYANLAPSSARFDLLTAVVGPSEGRGETYGAGMEWGESSIAGADFLPSRTYREWGFLAQQPTRARVVVKQGPKGVTVQNALGERVRHLVVATADGTFEVSDLRDGSEATASRVAHWRAPELGLNAAKRFNPRVHEQLDRPLRAGEFVAEVEGSGFLPTGGLRLNHHDSLQVVRGEVEQ